MKKPITYFGMTVLASKYREKTGVTVEESKSTVTEVLDCLIDCLCDSSKDGFQYIDCLTLRRVIRKQKLVRNPRSPEKTYIMPARVDVKVVLGKKVNNLINPSTNN